MPIRIETNNQAVLAALERLAKSARNPAPALKEIGERLVHSTQQRMAAEQQPDGTPFAPLSPVTLERKRQSRDSPSLNILRASGNLADLLHWQLAGSDALEVGSNAVYAAAMQFGMKKGSAGRSKHGPIPWGDIPARPYLGLSADDEQVVGRVIERYLSGG
jgi:phage virion morphogenesis protein